MDPALLGVTFTPSSTEAVSGSASTAGVAVVSHKLHGQPDVGVVGEAVGLGDGLALGDGDGLALGDGDGLALGDGLGLGLGLGGPDPPAEAKTTSTQ